MVRAFCYPLKPNKAQERVLLQWLSACQQIYNAALEEKRDAYRKQGVNVSRYTQQKELTEVRAQDPLFEAIPVDVLRSPLFRLDRAYTAFFRRVKVGQKPGFPRFRARDRYDSFSFFKPSIRGDRVLIPKLGHVKMSLYRPLRGTPKEVHVRRTASGWSISIVCDLGPAQPVVVDVEKIVGIDVGLKSLAVLSTGDAIENPRFFREGEALLARRQRALSTKKRGSQSRQRAKRLVGRAYAHVHNQRLDHARKTAKDLFDRFDVVAHEDLNIKGLIEKKDGPNLSKSINDASWRLLTQCLKSKAEEAGKMAVSVDPRGTTQRCSRCGVVVPKTLSDRIHSCSKCGLCLDRDHNAALNIRALGLSVARERLSRISRTEAPEHF